MNDNIQNNNKNINDNGLKMFLNIVYSLGHSKLFHMLS
jgi:hypothetical protein